MYFSSASKYEIESLSPVDYGEDANDWSADVMAIADGPQASDAFLLLQKRCLHLAHALSFQLQCQQ